MKYSIKRQMMTVFVGLILFMIVVFMIVNGSFLEKYYISNKKSEFIKAYTMVQEGVENGTIDSETPEKDLGRFTEKNNISIAVIDSEYNVVYTNVREKQMMVVQLFGYLYDKNHQEVLEKTDSYDICKSVDPQNNTEYLTMWGNFDNGDIFIMRSPLESIRSAVTIFNRFIGVVGGCVILVSVLLAWYFSKRITEPIMELATLSQKMADLDFDAKYTSGGSNEIGVLGENFNRMSERLEKTISNLKEANYKLQKDIEQKEKRENMRSEFLGNVSHELKTPLTVILSNAELLEGAGLAEKPARWSGNIHTEAQQMRTLVEQMLTLARADNGVRPAAMEPLNLSDVATDCVLAFEPVAFEEGKPLEERITADITVVGDADRLRRLISILLDNAVKYGAEGGHITLTLEKMDRQARLTVSNPGDPIPPEHLAHLFERFYRADASRGEKSGFGLGLAIADTIAWEHKGALKAESDAASTRFTFTIPLRKQA